MSIDVTIADQLLHGEEERVWGDAGYQGVHKRDEHKDRNVDWFIAKRPGQRKQWSKDDPREKLEQQKSSIRALVEHPFRYIKQVFGYSKTRYKGLKKNTDRIYMLLAFANLMITEKHRPA